MTTARRAPPPREDLLRGTACCFPGWTRPPVVVAGGLLLLVVEKTPSLLPLPTLFVANIPAQPAAPIANDMTDGLFSENLSLCVPCAVSVCVRCLRPRHRLLFTQQGSFLYLYSFHVF